MGMLAFVNYYNVHNTYLLIKKFSIRIVITFINISNNNDG